VVLYCARASLSVELEGKFLSDIIRIVIVDDHELMRRGLRETLTEQSDFEIVGEGGSVEDALQLVSDHHPDIILLDVNMPGNGVAVVKLLNNFKIKPKAIMFTIYENLSNVRECMTNGAHGYALKGIGGDELVAIVRMVHSGKKYVCPELAAKFLSEPVYGEGELPQETQRTELANSRLTEREMQILELIAKGKSNIEISQALDLSEATVKHYITPLFRKLGVKNRTEAALSLTGYNA
jgi:two-component system, NarL family, nitrate/nitrite response regulator NarL